MSAIGDTAYVLAFDGSVDHFLYRDEYYVDVEEVAAYVIAFKALPPNYMSTAGDSTSGYTKTKTACYNLYGSLCRITPGAYTSNYDYLPWTISRQYTEADIGGEDYAASSSWNRGALRLVIGYTGISAYGADIPVVFYTGDHYDTFTEYANYYGGWSADFGTNGLAWSAMATL